MSLQKVYLLLNLFISYYIYKSSEMQRKIYSLVLNRLKLVVGMMYNIFVCLLEMIVKQPSKGTPFAKTIMLRGIEGNHCTLYRV